jgi:hypothetical protein
VYWTTYNGGTVMSVNKDGTGLLTLSANQQTPSGIAVSGGFVYWTEYVPMGNVRALSLKTGVESIIAGGVHTPTYIAVDGAYAYFSSISTGDIQRAPLAGGKVEPVALGESSPGHLRLDSTRLYWNQNFGSLRAVTLDGGMPVTLVQGGLTAITIDEASIYYVNGSNLFRIAK